MPQSDMYGRNMAHLSLCRDEEEDLVDYGDSDIEIESGEGKKDPIEEATEEVQLDIYSDRVTQPESAQDGCNDLRQEEAKEQQDPDVKASNSSVTKTPQAAVLVKSLQDLLADPAFPKPLGLSTPGDNIDLGFWANGFSFALTLRLTAAVKAKACRFGAKCYKARCTFDHGDADRTATVAAGKPRKLCSMVNRPAGCSNGNACWFSHEAEGVMCADGGLRETCPRGVYCFYKHRDDSSVVSAGLIQTPAESIEIKEANELKTHARSSSNLKTLADVKHFEVSAFPANSTAVLAEQRATGRKRGRDTRNDDEDRESKKQRVWKSQEHPIHRTVSKSASRDPIWSGDSEQAWRGSSQIQRRSHDRHGRGRKDSDYRPMVVNRYTSGGCMKRGSLSGRITRD